MTTDWWPEADGVIVDGFTIGFCYADSTSITANGFVKKGANSGVGVVSVAVSAAYGDAWGMALKTPVATGDMIPILFYGVIKTLANATNVSIGSFVMNSITDGVSWTGTLAISNLVLAAGASYVLGMALQTTTAATDEFLVLVGKCI